MGLNCRGGVEGGRERERERELKGYREVEGKIVSVCWSDNFYMFIILLHDHMACIMYIQCTCTSPHLYVACVSVHVHVDNDSFNITSQHMPSHFYR